MRPIRLSAKFIRPRNPQAGFGLVEIMVGLVIGMFGILVALKVFADFEGQKRVTTSGAGALQNGAIALFVIERDARQSGYGINDSDVMGCTVNAYNALATAPGTFSFALSPAVIAQGAAGASDTLTFVAGSSSRQMSASFLTTNNAGDDADYKVDNRYGYATGDAIVLSAPGQPCTLAQVVGLPTILGSTDAIVHTQSNYTDAGGNSVASQYNHAGGLGLAYTANATKVMNLGSKATVNNYFVRDGRLWLSSALNSASPTPLVDGVVSLQAQYGFDTRAGTPSDLIVDTYSDAMIDANGDGTVGGSGDIARIGAMRLAIIARSSEADKPAADGTCHATIAAPTWAGGAVDVSADPLWQCYRYKVFETTVPLRNMIWKP